MLNTFSLTAAMTLVGALGASAPARAADAAPACPATLNHQFPRLQDEKPPSLCQYNGKVVLVEPRPRAAFQGWRYLEAKEAPRDLSRAAPGAAKMPETMRRELQQLGLL